MYHETSAEDRIVEHGRNDAVCALSRHRVLHEDQRFAVTPDLSSGLCKENTHGATDGCAAGFVGEYLGTLWSVRQINTRLRPDFALAQSWGRGQFAEQSTIARVLDSLEPEQATQARKGTIRLFHWWSRTASYDWHVPLMADIDLTRYQLDARRLGVAKATSPKKGAWSSALSDRRHSL